MIAFDRGDDRFNYRVGGLAIADGRILLQTATRIDFWVLPGGRAELGESAAETLRREMREELGLDVDVGRLLWVMENFFTLDGRRYHEIGFYFAMAVPPVQRAGHEWPAMDGGDCVFRWHPLDALDDLTILPSVLSTAVRSLPSVTTHIVHVDPAT